MAEEYVIRIKADESAQSEDTVPVAIPSQSGVSPPAVSKPQKTDTSASIRSMVVSGALMPALTTIASTAVSMVGLQTGNNRLQQKINVASSIAGKLAGAVGSIAAGYVVGNVPGAIVSAVAWSVNEAADLSKNVTRYGIDRQNEAYKLGVSRESAGIMTNRRR